MSYAKLQSSIITSTVWAECDTTRIVWITMLALADRDGYVAASVPGLAHVARVAREAVEQALSTLLSPDQDSRCKDFEGRRIRAVDGGWILLNYPRIRDHRTDEDRREYNRQWMADYRAGKHRDVDNPQNPQNPQSPKVDDVDTPAPAPAPDQRYRGRATALPTDFLLTPERLEYALRKEVTNPEKEFEAFRAHHEAHGKIMKSWDAAWRTWCLNAKKFRGHEPVRSAGSMGGVLR